MVYFLIKVASLYKNNMCIGGSSTKLSFAAMCRKPCLKEGQFCMWKGQHLCGVQNICLQECVCACLSMILIYIVRSSQNQHTACSIECSHGLYTRIVFRIHTSFVCSLFSLLTWHLIDRLRYRALLISF